MDRRRLKEAQDIALQKGLIKDRNDLKISTHKNKRFMIKPLHNDKFIHFGLYPFEGHGAYIDHQDNDIRKAWRARHSKIMKNGQPAYKDKSSPDFYSWQILW